MIDKTFHYLFKKKGFHINWLVELPIVLPELLIRSKYISNVKICSIKILFDSLDFRKN